MVSDGEVLQRLAGGERVAQPLRARAAADPDVARLVAELGDAGRLALAPLLARLGRRLAPAAYRAEPEVARAEAIDGDGFLDARDDLVDFLPLQLVCLALQRCNLFLDLRVGLGHGRFLRVVRIAQFSSL